MENSRTGKRLSWEQAVCWLREEPSQKDLVHYCFYDDPVQHAAERFYQGAEWSTVREMLRGHRHHKVLDIGAGRGISTYAFAKDGADVTALEPDPSEVVGSASIRSLAACSGLKITVLECDGENIPLPDNHFDVVYCRAVLHHAKNLKNLVKEAHRLLRPGGIFLATREHVISRREDLQTFLEAHPLHRLYGGEHAYLFAEYSSAIREAGFVKTNWVGPFESPVNYYPARSEDISAWAIRQLSYRLGIRLATCILALPAIKKIYLRWLSHRSNEPGRLFTFVARKAS